MIRFLRNLDLDRNSFWIGFLAGLLFWWFVTIVRPNLGRIWEFLKTQFQNAREGLKAGIGTRLRNDTLQMVQKLHLAAPLFSLDEVRIEPRLLAPKPYVQPGADPVAEDIIGKTLPYLPDWPELAASYGARTLSLAEALTGGANLVVIGNPGSGKTFALADLASQIARRDPMVNELGALLPLYLHVLDFALPEEKDAEAVAPLHDAIGAYASALTMRGLKDYLKGAFRQGRILLLLDGFDQLPPEDIDLYVSYLERLLTEYPNIRVVAAASAEYYGALTTIGLIPVPMAAWDARQRADFIRRWGDLWIRFIETEIWGPDGSTGETQAVEPTIIEGWLLGDTASLNPLELTLKAWAAYAGDTVGPEPMDAIDAYIYRLTTNIHKALPALEQLALQMTTSRSPLISPKDAGKWVARYEPSDSEIDDTQDLEIPPGAEEFLTAQQSVSFRRTIPALINSGLITIHSGSMLGFLHPVLLGYLAACALAAMDGREALISQPNWTTKSVMLTYLAAKAQMGALAMQFIERTEDPLHQHLLMVGRWLRNAPKNNDWHPIAKRRLAKFVQNDLYPLGLRGRAVAALATSGDPDVAVLFRHLLTSDNANVRQLSALAVGYLRDTKAIKDLSVILYDPNPNVGRAACLALVNIGSDAALEQAASALLHGDDDLRRAAAEAFANHPEEGYPILRDGAKMDDLLVRRAVVFGLERVGEDWAIDLLKQIQVEDGQWVVRNAATQALEELENGSPRIPQPRPILHETAWLIAFASERGLGVASGKPAKEMLFKALREGTFEERQAAMDYLGLHPDTNAILDTYHHLYGSDPDLKEVAFETVWQMAATGIDLPPPIQFGLGQ